MDGGLCSPGRWAPEVRKTKNYGLNDVRDTIFPLFQKSVVDERGRETTPMDFILRVAAGRLDASRRFDAGARRGEHRVDLLIDGPHRPDVVVGPAATYAQAYFSLKEGLESLFGRPVDLVTSSGLENPFFRERIDAECRMVYAR